jgi:hypothetical protein
MGELVECLNSDWIGLSRIGDHYAIVIAMNRYSAKLLFQFRVTIDGDSGKRRTCEERMVVFEAASASRALALAKRRGRAAQYSYKNSDGNPIDFEFIGIMDLLHLGPECEEDEVWYDITERLLPMERADRLIPPEDTLNAIRNERRRNIRPTRLGKRNKSLLPWIQIKPIHEDPENGG